MIEEAHERARKTLMEHMAELHKISELLIERETIDKDQFERLLAGEPEATVFPDESPKATEPSSSETPEKKPAIRPAPRPIPGAAMQPPAEGAAG